MRNFKSAIFLIFFTLVLLIPSGVLAQKIYRCEKKGEVYFTNISKEAKGCKVVKIAPPPPLPSIKGDGSSGVAEVNFPKVDSKTQKSRDVSKDELIRRELDSEKERLSALEDKLANYQIVGGPDQQQQIDTFKLLNEERSTRAKNIESLEAQLRN